MGFALSELKLTSPAFKHGGAIPEKHTGEREDVSPPLAWRDVPAAYIFDCQPTESIMKMDTSAS